MKQFATIITVVIIVVGLFVIYPAIMYGKVRNKCVKNLSLAVTNGTYNYTVTPIFYQGKIIGHFVYDSIEVLHHPGFDYAILEINGKQYYSKNHFCAGPDFDEYKYGDNVVRGIYIDDVGKFENKMISELGFKL